MALNFDPALSTALRAGTPLDKDHLRAWLQAILAAINSDLDPRATPVYSSRAAAVTNAPSLPASLQHIFVREGTALVVRSRTAYADDPLFAEGSRWGVVQRQDTAAEGMRVDEVLEHLGAVGWVFANRAAAVDRARNLPTNVRYIFTFEGSALVARSSTASSDDPLYETGARWGVVQRQDVGAEAQAREQAIAAEAEARERLEGRAFLKGGTVADGTDISSITVPGVYHLSSSAGYTYAGFPEGADPNHGFRLIVTQSGGADGVGDSRWVFQELLSHVALEPRPHFRRRVDLNDPSNVTGENAWVDLNAPITAEAQAREQAIAAEAEARERLEGRAFLKGGTVADGTDISSITVPGVYHLSGSDNYAYGGLPEAANLNQGFRLVVMQSGGADGEGDSRWVFQELLSHTAEGLRPQFRRRVDLNDPSDTTGQNAWEDMTAPLAAELAARVQLEARVTQEEEDRRIGDLLSLEAAADAARPSLEFYGDDGLSGDSYVTTARGETLAIIDDQGRFVPPPEGEFYGENDWSAAFTDRDGNPVLLLDENHQPVPVERMEFYDSADWSVALATSDGTPVFLIGPDGRPYPPEEPASSDPEPLVGYVDGDELRAVGASDEVAAPLGDFRVLALDGGSDRALRAVIDWPALGRSRVVAAGGGLLVPDQENVLHGMIGLGQSLMVGSMSASSLVSIRPEHPDWVLMFKRGDGLSDVRMGLITSDGSGAPALDPADLVGFEPLVARVGQGGGSRGETPMEALCAALQREAQALRARHRMLAFTAAMGATTYANLKKGSQTYTNMLAALARAKELAEAEGWRFMVDGCVVRHGEGDANSNSYDQMLAEWQADIEADVQAITGQQASVPFIVAQTSSFSAAGNAARGMLAAHNSNPNVHLAGPDYPFADLYAADLVHMTGPGYFVSGEYMARAWRHALWSAAGKPKVTQMLSAVRTGTSVVIDYEVPVAPLVIDLVSVPERDVAGFQYRVGAESIGIQSAVVTGPAQITLTLAEIPSGSDEAVYYAAAGHSGARTSEAIPRGNVRDSAPDRSALDGRRLANWACHQIIPVSIA